MAARARIGLPRLAHLSANHIEADIALITWTFNGFATTDTGGGSIGITAWQANGRIVKAQRMAAMLDPISRSTIVVVHSAGKAIRAAWDASSGGFCDVYACFRIGAGALGTVGGTFTGLASSHHASDAFSISNKAMVYGLAKLSFAAVIDLINI